MKIRSNFQTLPRLILLVASIFAFCALNPPTASSAQWVKRFNGSGNGDDTTQAMAVDPAGNVYVAGESVGTSSGLDYTTVKYDTNGVRQWVMRYNGPANSLDSATAIAVDAAGNVYVTGFSLGTSTAYDYATIKYDTNGIRQWVARYDSPAHKNDCAQTLVVDAAGNVYVTGYSAGTFSAFDYATVKYDSNGNQLWVKRYNGPTGGDDYAKAIAVDAVGNVYVTGESDGGASGVDYATVVYNSNGNPKWAQRYNGPADGDDRACALALDSLGNVYVTGESAGVSSGSDYATIRYGSNGKQKWVRRYNGPGNSSDSARSIAVDSAGKIYVTGDSLGISSSNDCTTIKYDVSGNRKWVERYNGPVNGGDFAYALALDAASNVHIVGESVGISSTWDYLTIKYDTNGKKKWTARFNGPANNDDNGRSIGLDSSGNVYVTGWSTGASSGRDYLTIKYSPSGN